MGDDYLISALHSAMTEVETEQEMTRTDVATYLREFADKLDGRATEHPESNRQEGTGRRSTDAARDDAGADPVTRESDTDATGTREKRTEGSDDGGRDETEGRTASKPDERITFMVGNESATINPPETVRFQMAVESDSTILESGTREIVEFSLHWDSENVADDGTLDIQ